MAGLTSSAEIKMSSERVERSSGATGPVPSASPSQRACRRTWRSRSRTVLVGGAPFSRAASNRAVTVRASAVSSSSSSSGWTHPMANTRSGEPSAKSTGSSPDPRRHVTTPSVPMTNATSNTRSARSAARRSLRAVVAIALMLRRPL